MYKDNGKNPRLFSVSQVAKRLGVSRARVHQYIEEGRLRAQRDPHSNWFLIDERDIEKLPLGRDWREEHGIEPADEVRLLVSPYCTGTVKEVHKPDILVVTCPKPSGIVHVSAWDVEKVRVQ